MSVETILLSDVRSGLDAVNYTYTREAYELGTGPSAQALLPALPEYSIGTINSPWSSMFVGTGGVTATGTVSAGKIVTADGSAIGKLDASKLFTGTLPAERVANVSITGAKIAAKTIRGSEIADATLETIHLANGSVTDIKVASISAAKLTSGTLPVVRGGTGATTSTGTGAVVLGTSPTLSNPLVSGAISISGAGGIGAVSGKYGTIQTSGSGKGGWYGYSIEGNYVLMAQDARCGIYDEANNQWMTQWYANGATELLHSGATKLETTSSGVTVTGVMSASSFSGSGAGITTLNAANISSGTITAARIPGLDASKISAGTFADARIPALNANKINAGTFADARIPNLNASKITAGTLAVARGGTGTTTSTGGGSVVLNDAPAFEGSTTMFRTVDGGYGCICHHNSANWYLIPTNQNSPYGIFNSLRPFKIALNTGHITMGHNLAVEGVISGNGSGLTSLNAGNVTTGTLADARIPNLNASKITVGTFTDARIPALNAGKITAGIFEDARIPSLNASKINAGTLADARIPNLNASKITAGTLPVARGGTGTTTSTGTGGVVLHTSPTFTGTPQFTSMKFTSTTNSTKLQLHGTEYSLGVDSGTLRYNSNDFHRWYHGTTLGMQLDGNNLSVTGTVSGNGSGLTSLNASNISSGTINAARIPGLDAGKISAGSLNDARIPALNASKINAGTFADARIPSLNASKINAGTLEDARIPNLSASKIATGTLAVARGGTGTSTSTGTGSVVLNTNPIFDGKVAIGRINSEFPLHVEADSDIGNAFPGDFMRGQIVISGKTEQGMRLVMMYDTTLNIGVIQSMYTGMGGRPLCINPKGGSASNVGIGTTAPTQKLHVVGNILASGTVYGNGSGLTALNASNISSGTINAARIPGLDADKISAGTLADARIPALNASKINAGTLADARIPALNASKINAGTFADARIPNLNANKINAGTLAVARGGTGTTSATGTGSVVRNTAPSFASGNWITSSDGKQRLNFGNNSTTYIKSPADIRFRVNDGNDTMVFSSTSRLGVGTLSPTEKLHVVGNILATGDVTAQSDARLKTDLHVIDDAMSKIRYINGYTYALLSEDTAAMESGERKRRVGLIAQELQAVLPEAVSEADDDAKTLSVAYGNVVALLVEGMKEQDAELQKIRSFCIKMGMM